MPDIFDEIAGENPYGTAPSGRVKGKGYLGELQRSDGRVSTELSIGVNLDGEEVEIPSIVPTSTPEELEYLLNTNPSPDMWKTPIGSQIVSKAVDFAKQRRVQGKSPFAQKGEQVIKRDIFDEVSHETLAKKDIFDEVEETPIYKQALAIPITTLKGAVEGLTTGIPEMFGAAAEFHGGLIRRGIEAIPKVGPALKKAGLTQFAPGAPAEAQGKALKEWAERKAKEWYGDPEERKGIERIGGDYADRSNAY